MSNWPHLPPELLDKIFALLSVSDRLRARSICSSWRSAVRQSNSAFPIPFEPPRLLLTQPDNSISFFDIFRSKPISFSLPPPHRRAHCFGTLAGWFVLVSDQNPSHACLFNPVQNTEVPLPDLEFPIKKAILSAPPGFPNCVVAVMGRSSSIALCEPAGKIWRVLPLGNHIIKDMVFWQNQLCIVDIQGHVLICKFDMDLTIIQTIPLPSKWSVSSEVFLVESTGGDLLLVLYDRHHKFWVFQLDQRCTWVPMDQIGDQALFLSMIQSMSVPVNQFFGTGLRENSIYWTSRKFNSYLGIAAAYSMEVEVMSAVPVSVRYSILAEPVWISPVIWP